MTSINKDLSDLLVQRRNPKPFPFLRGVNFGYLSRQGYFGSKAAEVEVERMAEAGVEWVSLLVMLMQETFYSTRIFRDFRYTPSDFELEKIVRCFQKRGIRVLLKPIIDPLDSAHRGRISFPDGDQQIQGVVTDYWSRWFESNREALLYYVRLSRELGIEAFTVAQELSGTERQSLRWMETISLLRDEYPHWLCTNSNGNIKDPLLREWVRTLDAFGCSNYNGVPVENPTIAEISKAVGADRDTWHEFSEAVHLPIYWAEFGCRSVSNGARLPYEYRNDGDFDGRIQADYMEGFLQAYVGQPWWRGFQYWKWEEQQNRPHYKKPDGDTGFTVQGKPAEGILRRWCVQGRTQSGPSNQ